MVRSVPSIRPIFGFKLHLLTSLNGVILDFELALANETDVTIGLELLEGYQDLEVMGDKAYLNRLEQLRL